MAGKFYDLARMNTATVGSGTITLGAAVAPFLSFAAAGVQDGDVVSYAIIDGNNSEVGWGTYAAAGTTLARTTVLASTNGGLAISLSGSAQVFITMLAQDFGSMASQSPSAVAITGGTITGMPTPSGATDVAIKSYVDALSAGLSFHTSVRVATTAALSATYANGTAGVGATLTNSGALAAIAVDGISLASGDRLLVKNQGTASQNGIYTVTTVGSGAVAWVLTRATDFDEASSSQVVEGAAVLIEEGTANAATLWIETGQGPFTLGTTSILFSELAVPAGVLLASNNLSDLGNVATAKTNLGLAAVASSGSASDLSTGTLPAARLPTPAASTLGGIKSSTAAAHKFATGVDTTGAVVYTQPAFADVSGTIAATQLPAATASALGGVEPDGTSIANSGGAISVAYGTAANTAAQGNDARFCGFPIISKSSAYTFVLGDAGQCYLHPAADTTARTWTIPANSSVAYPVGTEIAMINQNAAGVITISITTDTMRLAGSGTTGNRTLSANGVAVAKKITATEWIITGTGLS